MFYRNGNGGANGTDDGKRLNGKTEGREGSHSLGEKMIFGFRSPVTKWARNADGSLKIRFGSKTES
jgi:hypothetical protein